MRVNFYENERVALFIDGANLYSAARALGFDIDYRRLLNVFRDKGRLVRAYYYSALVEDHCPRARRSYVNAEKKDFALQRRPRARPILPGIFGR